MGLISLTQVAGVKDVCKVLPDSRSRLNIEVWVWGIRVNGRICVNGPCVSIFMLKLPNKQSISTAN